MLDAAGTRWRTDLTLTNPSRSFLATGEVIFHSDSGAESRMMFTLPPQAVVQYRDVLATLGHETGHGSFRVVTSEPQRSVIARARIYNVGSTIGEFGQDVPGIPMEQLVRRSIVAGLSSTDGNRTNIGISNPHASTVPVSVSWYDGDGEAHGQVLTIDIPARGVLQINDIFDWTGRPPGIPLSIVVRSADAATPVCAWGSIVRNESGDATFVAGQEVVD